MPKRALSRREFLVTSAATACALALPKLRPVPRVSTRVNIDHPNVLLIAIDDLNDWVGCLGGHPDAQTPNLDRLAERGVLFTNAHCAAPACNPARAAIFTGIRPCTSGIYQNNQPWRWSPVLREAVTIPQHFRAHGYRALASGKVLHYPDPDSWDEYWPSQTETRPPDPRPLARPVNDIPDLGELDWAPLDVPNEAMGDWQVADWVSDRLAQPHEHPFFLACGFYRPHLPWYVPRAYFDLYPLEEITLPNVKEDDLDDVPRIGQAMANRWGANDHQKIVQHNAPRSRGRLEHLAAMLGYSSWAC